LVLFIAGAGFYVYRKLQMKRRVKRQEHIVRGLEDREHMRLEDMKVQKDTKAQN
jgi:hypothetical protein